MTEALLVSNAILWIAVVALGLVAVALARQVGILYERIAPAGALVIDRGPGVGTHAPLFELRDLLGRTVKLGGVRGDGRNTVLLFVSPSCPMCKKLLPIARSILRSERSAALVLASDGEEAEQRAFIERERLEAFPYVLSRELGMSYQVGKLPYAVLIDAEGVIRAKGLINTREHFESLFEASDRGVASLQEYLRAERA